MDVTSPITRPQLKVTLGAVVLLVSILTAFWFTWHRGGISALKAEIISVNDKDALCLYGSEVKRVCIHAFKIDIEDNENIIRIDRYYKPLTLFSPRINNRWPVVIQRGLNNDCTYSIEYWTGSAYKKHATLQIDKNGKYKLLNISR